MEFEKIKTILEAYGIKKEEKEYFLNLSMHLANCYYNFFNNQKIDELYKNGISLEATKLNLEECFPNEKDRNYLEYNKVMQIPLNSKSFITCDYTGQVQDFVINGQKMLLGSLNILEALNIAMQYSVIKDKNIINQIFEIFELISSIYYFAFLILIHKQKNIMDKVRTGMFQNAYFNLINLNQNLEQIKTLVSESRVTTITK